MRKTKLGRIFLAAVLALTLGASSAMAASDPTPIETDASDTLTVTVSLDIASADGIVTKGGDSKSKNVLAPRITQLAAHTTGISFASAGMTSTAKNIGQLEDVDAAEDNWAISLTHTLAAAAYYTTSGNDNSSISNAATAAKVLRAAAVKLSVALLGASGAVETLADEGEANKYAEAVADLYDSEATTKTLTTAGQTAAKAAAVALAGVDFGDNNSDGINEAMAAYAAYFFNQASTLAGSLGYTIYSRTDSQA
ncbi:MAG: hypothetical protein II948_07895, partial [Synergistaceae bacterium]|nr:hypothetical protein [Synergistaceae bacterium]